MSLSVCLLTRNDERRLSPALRSVAGLADQVLVVDTGSTDHTMALAEELGARVFSFVWDDDFAAGQNYALEQATGDWVLWLNPDEEVLADGHAALHAAMARPDAIAYYLRVQDQLRADKPEEVAETLQLRLFRRHSELRYAGRLHPHFIAPVGELARRENKQVESCTVTIRRHAYLSLLDEGKLRWTLRLLERELHDRPGQLHYLIEYGRTLLWLNDPRGHEVLAEAAAQLVPLRQMPDPPTVTVGLLLEYLLTVSPEQSRSRLSREDAAELALRWFPSSPPMLWHLAEQSFQAGRFAQAANLLERLVRFGKNGSYDRSQGFDPSILGDPAVMNLGICYLRLGQLDPAEGCFQQLATSKTHGEKAAQNLQVIAQLRQPGGRP